jgi:putative restriction endonuclease
MLSARGVEDAPTPEDQPARSSAFRRKILQIYRGKCTACGIELQLPEPAISLVEAAHIVPFCDSHDDHPSNGLALCKNHHWAMDSKLIAPSPKGFWVASPRLLPHRSRGEQELAGLDGRVVLPPAEPAFAPRTAGLELRLRELLR